MAATTDRLSGPWPLTGRHEALDAACSALLEEGASAFVLVGEPGTGKTRLAHEILRRVEDAGRTTARVRASAAARVTPLAAVAHLLPPGATDDPSQLLRSMLDSLHRDDRTILHVDDAHELDESSALLLSQLCDLGAVQLVVSVRSNTPLPGAIARLRTNDTTRTMTVDALDAISTDTLLHRVLGAPLDGAAEAQLLETSGGNPLFLRELVLGAIADGTLREIAGVWRLDGNLAANRAIGERILGRVEALSDEARAALEFVAVGEPVGLDDLERNVSPRLLEDLETRGLIRVEDDQRRKPVRLGHPVYGEVLRGELGHVRSRRLAREHAERVTAHGARRREDALQIARWQIEAGLQPDPEVVLAGARIARHTSDWTTTAVLAQAAFDGGALAAAPLLAEALFELGRFTEVEQVVDAALAAGAADEAAFAQLRRTKATALMWGRDQADDAIALLAESRDEVRNADLKEVLEFSRSSLLTWSGRPVEALRIVEPLLASEHDSVAAQAALIVELAAATMGPAGRAVDLADHWFPIHLALPDLVGTSNPGNHLVTKAVALTNAGRLLEAQALADFGYGAAVNNRSLIGQMWFALELGRIALMRGDALTADRWFREQIALCRGTGHRRPVTLGLGGLAVSSAYLGEPDAAQEAVAEMDAAPTAIIELLAVEAARARGWALAAAGDLSNARAAFLQGAEEAEARGIVLMAALARFDAVRVGDRNQREVLATAATDCDSRIIELAAAWAEAIDDPAALEAVANEFEAIGGLMFAAEATAAAANAWRANGENRRATAAEQRADALARQCRGAKAPTLTTVDTVVALTPREREIAILVAQGLTSKDVGERLFLSARTVSNHLQNVYTKLGISKRSEVAEALGRLGEGSTP
jgi:DNA-binding NarL/FixJ family response regulator